jgi:hypothetical protein
MIKCLPFLKLALHKVVSFDWRHSNLHSKLWKSHLNTKLEFHGPCLQWVTTYGEFAYLFISTQGNGFRWSLGSVTYQAAGLPWFFSLFRLSLMLSLNDSIKPLKVAENFILLYDRKVQTENKNCLLCICFWVCHLAENANQRCNKIMNLNSKIYK